MIPIEQDKKHIIKLARMVASHTKVKINDHFTLEVKPARRGKIYGNGTGKKPQYPYRIKITPTLEFKKMVNDFIEQV